MKKVFSLAILCCQMLLVACGHTRFKTYRSISVNVIDKKLPEEQAKFYQQLQHLKSMYDIAVEKYRLGEKSTDAESYDSMSYEIERKNNSLEFNPQDILLPSAMNPDWIEVNEEHIIFEDRQRNIIKSFKILSIDNQEGIDDADWYIKIDDPEIEKAVLTNGVLQLKSYSTGHYDYAYKFYFKQ